MKGLTIIFCLPGLFASAQDKCYQNYRKNVDITMNDSIVDYNQQMTWLTGTYHISNDTLYIQCIEGLLLDAKLHPDTILTEEEEDAAFQDGKEVKFPLVVKKRYLLIKPYGSEKWVKLRKCREFKWSQGYKDDGRLY